VGAWNKGAAEQSGLVDDVVTYAFFPEVSRDWRGEPAQDLDIFRAATRGQYDIAIDLRVDEDTHHLLLHVDAGTRCGIGEPERFPYLQVILPYDIRARHNKPQDGGRTLLFSPDDFHSRMPVRTPFRHRTNFSVSNQHLIYGPYISLPAGRYRATFGLQVSGLRLALRRVRLKLDVCFGQSTVAERDLTADQLRGSAGDAITIDFTNPADQDNCEFRVLAFGRPPFASLSFYGVRVEKLEPLKVNRLKPAMLHIGEHLSLLVRLVADRTSALYLAPEPVAHAPGDRRRVVIAPLSNSSLRDWPLEHYVALTRMLVEQLACTVLLIGSRPQQSALAHIVQASGAGPHVVNLAGQTGWNDVPDILRSADLVICNNSGVAHMAASLGIRTLAIYSASHQPQEWGPRGSRARALMAVVPCSPCGFDRLEECVNNHACMRGLLPETVFSQAASWLNES
jgi:ADP-heptose:LPS heptosyltransferase